MRGLVALVLFVTFLAPNESAAQRAPARGDDIREFYRASARDDGAAMLRAALRLAEGRRGPHWPTVVGDLLWQGRGNAADPAEAVTWYRRAAVRGGDAAMLALARAHHSGKGVEQDEEAAFFWLQQAAARRQSRAMLELAIHARRGFPFARDESYVDRQIGAALELILERARRAEESDADAMPARRAAYVRVFRIAACPWTAAPDHVLARRFLVLAIKESWGEGTALLPRFDDVAPAVSDVCGKD